MKMNTHMLFRIDHLDAAMFACRSMHVIVTYKIIRGRSILLRSLAKMCLH